MLSFSIHIPCTHCQQSVDVPFSPHSPLPWVSCCPLCGKQFGIESETLASQICLFTDLCEQMEKSKEILSESCIAVTVGAEEVKIPFKLLLTRLKSTFDLEIDGQKCTVTKRTQTL